ncbi:hypothetical protein AWJ20_2945 [Sugiyamaella lignohabitans]|uniref:Uncharacterized protein n=1 Tax=Sugiyamaella lignohabitans TaxID=796027 RepID=A0A167FHW6_9ASCO|nr:uncharacterized protein AWJ20_2945 [Sugiyamaella lignohabitans]ANB15318.1 hypothetical protein AWJ20_2945 [Sugiyamaella lignohabitans]
MSERRSKVLIIGAGYGGIATAIRLLDSVKTTDFHIYDKESTFGGTWWVNKYPGCAVDIPAFFYSISSDQITEWSKLFPPQEEIIKYVHTIVKKRGLNNYATFEATVQKLDWDIENEEWVATIKLKDGSVVIHRATVVVSARGGLADPSYPSIPGLEVDRETRVFKGDYAHSAKYDTNIVTEGKDVIIIGNGCSAAQIIPAIADEAKSVSQFARSSHWLMPQPKASPKVIKWIIEHIIGYKLARFLAFFALELQFPMFQTKGFLTSIVRGLSTRLSKKHVFKTAPKKYHDMLIPDFKIGCKRRIFDDGYLQSLNNENVLLTKDPIVSVTEDSVVTKSGERYHADVIIAATGFDIKRSAGNVDVYGINKKEDMKQYWDRTGLSAYSTAQVPGYPNFFIVGGPNHATGHTSVILQIENILTYVEKVGRYVFNGTASSVDVKATAYEEWKDELAEASKNSVIIAGGCSSWYVEDGRNIAFYPWSQITYWYRSTFPKFQDQTYHWTGKNQFIVERQRKLFALGSLAAVASAIAYRFT